MGRLAWLAVVAAWGAGLGLLRWHDAHARFEPHLGTPLTAAVRGVLSGYDNLVADGLYLRFIQHFGRCLARREAVGGALPWLRQVTALDPRFEGAYVMGAMALGAAGDVDAVEAIWADALRQWPTRSDLAYEAGMHLFLFGTRPDQYLRAARLFGRAAALPGARPECRAMEARMYQVTGRQGLAVAIWRATYRTSPSAETRAVAARTLARWGVSLDERSSR